MRTGTKALLLGAWLWVGACGPAASESGEPNGVASGGDTSGSGGSVVASGGSSSSGAGLGGASGGAGASGGTSSGGGGTGTGGCPFEGRITYQLNGAESWPTDVTPLITAAMDSALEYYNCYADLEKAITVNYNPGVPTAEANVDGWLSFGSSQSYMQVATATHEVAQASEYQSEWSLINHVRIVAAMHQDKRAYLDGEL